MKRSNEKMRTDREIILNIIFFYFNILIRLHFNLYITCCQSEDYNNINVYLIKHGYNFIDSFIQQKELIFALI